MDHFDELLDVLAHGKTCKVRRRAVVELKDLGDPRAIAALATARDRTAGWLGVTRANACALKDIDETLRVLQASTRTPETNR